MSKYLFDDDIPEARCGQQCYVPVEDIWEHVERQLCKPRKPCCPPRTKARDAIRIEKEEASRCFHYGRKLCNGTYEQSIINRYYRMDVREKGYCDVLLSIPPDRATMDGAICWVWPKEFHKLPRGYYEADVYIDGCLCYTHLFYIPEFRLVGQSAEVTYKSECTSCSNCGDVHNSGCGCDTDLCGSSIPTVDEDVVEHKAVGCETGCK